MINQDIYAFLERSAPFPVFWSLAFPAASEWPLAAGALAIRVLACILTADFLSGFFHWLEDSYGEESWPITGRHVTQGQRSAPLRAESHHAPFLVRQRPRDPHPGRGGACAGLCGRAAELDDLAGGGAGAERE